jgi:hypothetical protein
MVCGHGGGETMSGTTYDFPAIRRGDTWPGRIIAILTDTDTGDPVTIASARMQVRAAGNRGIIHEWTTAGDAPNLTISGDGSNTLTAATVAPAVTESWPVGVHVYDLELTLGDSAATRITVPDGRFPIAADVTRD